VGAPSAAFRLVAIAANTNAAKLARQILSLRPAYAALADPAALPQLRELLGGAASGTRLLAGPGALEELACLGEVQCVMAAIVGAAGLASTLAADPPASAAARQQGVAGHGGARC